MENLKNDAKKPELLSDEELKKVDGGAVVTSNLTFCLGLSPNQCKLYKVCEWSKGKCVNKY